jgi:hypothetical protein
MEDRKPFKLNKIIYIYNVLQIITNFGIATSVSNFKIHHLTPNILAVLFQALSNSYLQKDYSFTCELPDTSKRTPSMQKLVRASYFYFLLKIFDLLDTVRALNL